MVARSYVGETQDGRCSECGYEEEIYCDEVEQMRRDPYNGFCPDCDKLVEWEPIE
jgi:hypothetical protein